MHGVRKARIELGEYAAITGMGLVGQLALQLASKTGCEVLIAIDPCNARMDMAKRLGATHVLNPNEPSFKSEVNSITGNHGLDVTIEASGYPQSLISIFDCPVSAAGSYNWVLYGIGLWRWTSWTSI